MKRLATVPLVLLAVYVMFNMTVGVLMTGKVNEFDKLVSDGSPPRADSTPVDSSVCALLAERDNWRGQLQAIGFPFAARASDRILQRYSFHVDAGSNGQVHCGKFNNRIIARLRAP